MPKTGGKPKLSEFLHDFDPRPWRNAPDWLPDYLQLAEFYLPEGDGASSDISVRVVDADRRPRRADVERLWQSLSQTYALILVVRYEANGSPVADLAGGRQFRAGDTGRPRPIISQKVPIADAANLCRVVLAETNANAANRLIARWMDDRASDLKGMKNDGLFARHALLNVVPDRDDWEEHSARALPLRAMTGRDLVRSLGFQLDEASEPSAALLVVDGVPQATAIFLDGDGTFDTPSAQFGAESPVAHAMAIARKHRVNWVVLTRGKGIRLHPVSPDVGVGRRGRSTTYVEINLGMLPEDQIGFLWTLFSADALREGGYLDEILAASERFANDLGTRLRDRVYNEVVPVLATSLGRDLQGSEDENWLDEAYHRTMVALFRLLFIAYAEDKGLLPYERNVPYTNASLKRMATGLVEYVNGEREFDEESTVLWRSVQNLWRAVDKGKPDWGIPQYNGGLFSSASETGAALDGLELSDAEFGKALARLLVDIDHDGVAGPVDFRSLSVREFGTIYEGLLESELSVAETDLKVDRQGNYLTADGDAPDISAGEVYIHNQSGARKSSGSYFTKPLAVEHLLNGALESALNAHLEVVSTHLSKGDDAAASAKYFDFRCVDIAMGSGHFLVAAVDRIESRLTEFLAENPIPGVTRELEALRNAALSQLENCADDALITDEALLRRQVARRCIYGVDLNPISVELARLGIWIHTFVPGLPLSFLDHNLVVGNSLTGIGTIDEAREALGEELGSADLLSMIQLAEPALERLATVSDATVKDIRLASEAHREATEATAPLGRLFDAVVLSRARLGGFELLLADEATVDDVHKLPGVDRYLNMLDPLHFPVAFPEVFLRDDPGFDCILGNPPWSEVLAEELQFWSRRFPGLKGLDNATQQRRMSELASEYENLASELEEAKAAAEVLRQILTSGVFPGMETGDPDLYKAFLWRFANLVSSTGTVGVVLPRSVFAALGSAPWRKSVIPTHDLDIVLCKNEREWLFTDVNPGYAVCLVAIMPMSGEPELRLRGTYRSSAEYVRGLTPPPAVLPAGTLWKLDENYCVPAIETREEMELLGRLALHPLFGDLGRPDWCSVPTTELHVTNDREEFFTDDEGLSPIYNHRNVGHFAFDLTPGAFNWADLDFAKQRLQEKRVSTARRQRSPFRGMPPGWEEDLTTLPCANPRLAFRSIIHSTNPRKVWFAVVPSDCLLTNASPYLNFWRGGLAEQAYVLGLMNSSVVDWFGHLRVNLNLNYFILNSIPVPLKDESERSDRLVTLAAGLALASEGNLGRWGELGSAITSEEDRGAAVAEIDAIATLLYGLAEADLPLIFNTETRPALDDVLIQRKKWS